MATTTIEFFETLGEFFSDLIPFLLLIFGFFFGLMIVKGIFKGLLSFFKRR